MLIERQVEPAEVLFTTLEALGKDSQLAEKGGLLWSASCIMMLCSLSARLRSPPFKGLNIRIRIIIPIKGGINKGSTLVLEMFWNA